MSGRRPIFYSALMLTFVNLLLRFVGTSFQVYISGRLGAAGVGLLQLVLSVGSLAMVASIGGVRTAAMYLTAEELGKDRKQNVPSVLSACFLYSIALSGTVAAGLYLLAPFLSEHWIGSPETVPAFRLFAAFLPVSCLCAVMTGCFTAANRIGTLSAVEIAEQFCSMSVTMVLLGTWAGADPGRACMSVIFGSCVGACLTLGCLVYLHLRKAGAPGPPVPMGRRLLEAAVPLALADVLKSGITTAENLMVPRRLGRNPSVADPLAAFGTLSGMVFPVLMFPACLLFGLAELLIPELARCAAAGNRKRIRHLVKRSLKTALVFGLLSGGILALTGEALCLRLYGSATAGTVLKRYALLAPMLYCDAITDAMTKGLGQQKACVRYNILTSAMDVLFLYFLLPEYGMEGYFLSFLITHLLNFLLSLGRLLKISGVRLPFYIPALSLSAAFLSLVLSFTVRSIFFRCIAYPALLLSLLTLFGILRQEDRTWLRGVITG